MANDFFLKKIVTDELRETIFFATGERPVKEKNPDFVTLTTSTLHVKIVSPRKMFVNSQLCKSVYEAKYKICDIIAL